MLSVTNLFLLQTIVSNFFFLKEKFAEMQSQQYEPGIHKLFEDYA